jgi:hypothetical protein
MALFSIVGVHYQGTVSHEVFLRGYKCLLEQTFRDYEVLLYHDGPLLDPSIMGSIPIRYTDRRYADWGHTLRDIGIREAKGDYIVHFNMDNILYPNALEEIAKEIRRPSRLIDEKGQVVDTNNIIIFPVKMWGVMQNWHLVVDRPRRDLDYYMIMTGNPPYMYNIDCMQLVMKRELWLAEGGWKDKARESDGKMYQDFAMKYRYRHVGPVLGEHF